MDFALSWTSNLKGILLSYWENSKKTMSDDWISWLPGISSPDSGNSSVVAWMVTLITLLTIFLSIIYMIKTRMRRTVVSIPEVQTNRKYRFRKRDKVQFYARKVLRKGKDTASKLQRQVSLIKQGVSVPEYSRSGRRLEKRERMMILAKKVFSGKKKPSLLKKKELPSQVLEADIMDEGIQSLPDEVLYLLQSVKVFGHFEKGVFLQLCRHMETLHLNAGEHLFKVGEADKWLYVVQEGQVDLYIIQDRMEVKLSEVNVGESLHSLLSILDVLTGHLAPYKTVLARAVKKSIVIRLPAEAFSEAFRNHKDSLVQIVQVIMTRLQRVTFLALHNYLGLSQELLKPTDVDLKDKLKIRKRSSTQALLSLLEKHKLSSSTLEEQLNLEPHDKLPVRQTVSVKSLPCETHSAGLRSMSLPSSAMESPSKVKQLRFTEVDTVVDEGDNVFHRQSSFPLNQRNFLKENIRKAQNVSAADSLTSVDSCDVNDSTSSLEGSDRQASQLFELNEPEVLELVTQDLCSIFGIDDGEILQENISLLKVRKDFQLVTEGDQDVSLYFVVTGLLKVTQTLPEVGFEEQREVLLFNAKPGMITGQLAVLTGEHSFFGVAAVIDSVIARIARHSFYKMMRKYPHMVLNTAHTVMERVSPFVRQIDFALDWVVVEAGKPLYKQNTSSDCMHIVLHGRLRSVCTKPDGRKVLEAEFGKGEIVGMNEALRDCPRPTSLHAVRDTELAKIPAGLIKHIRSNHPSVVSRLVSLMSDKLMVNMLSQKKTTLNQTIDFHTHTHHVPEETKLAYGNVSTHLANLSTVAILPASSDVPLDKFSMELHHALTHICGNGVLRLHSKLVKQRLGNNALDSVHDYRLSNWLAHHEDMHHIVLYQTDSRMTPWTQRCIRQADAILIVALGDSEPSVGELESQLEGMAVRALKVLVLLHRAGIVRPTRTVDWLNMRGWLTDHVHIKGSKRLFVKTKKSKMEDYWEKVRSKPVNKFSDFSRLARFLTGTTIALVLGGGGARGLSHAGIIQALISAGIPFDMVGGTSIGAFVGGLWAAHRDMETVRERTLILCDDMGSILSKLFDLTYPFTSMFSGSGFNKPIKQVFEDIQIEDLWLPYFTVTTDITSSEMKVHTDGWLWRYVRSSMSLSGYLPPLCDPKDGHLLMDGGYINNLPGDVAHARGACKVIAVDVGAQDDQDFTNYGDSLSGWWLLWKRLSGRWTGRIKVPDLNDIQSRLSYISCNYLLEKVIHSDYCYYIRPPISTYKTLEFHKHQELFEVGLKHGQGIFTDEWTTKFWKDLLQDRSIAVQPASSKGRVDVSFTDLSEFVQLDGRSDLRLLSDLDSENEFELGYESSPEVFFSSSSNLRRLRSEPHDMYKLTSLSDVEGSSLTRVGSADSFHRLPHERRSSLGEERSVRSMDFSSDDEDDTDSGKAFSPL